MITLFNHTIGIAISLSLLAGCKSAETPPTDRVSLGVNKSARINADITIRVDTIRDSRCPIRFNCIVAGIVFVSAVVESESSQQRVRLSSNNGPSRPDSTGVILAGQTYKVVLRDVTPYPDFGSVQAEKQAIIQVTKL